MRPCESIRSLANVGLSLSWHFHLQVWHALAGFVLNEHFSENWKVCTTLFLKMERVKCPQEEVTTSKMQQGISERLVDAFSSLAYV